MASGTALGVWAWARRNRAWARATAAWDSARVLQTIQPMAMALRRHMCVGLVGTQFRTFDNMMAFAKSVNFVVGECELPKIKGIARQAVAENDQFYRVFRESLRDAGKM